jgi:hypothetical protein
VSRAEFDKLEDAVQQRAIMEDFVRVIARLHRLEPAELGLQDILGQLPLTASACALNELYPQRSWSPLD